jgi:hypothetical protein
MGIEIVHLENFYHTGSTIAAALPASWLPILQLDLRRLSTSNLERQLLQYRDEQALGGTTTPGSDQDIKEECMMVIKSLKSLFLNGLESLASESQLSRLSYTPQPPNKTWLCSKNNNTEGINGSPFELYLTKVLKA